MDVPRYTANEIEDFIYDGMDPEVELVPAQCYDALEAERDALKIELMHVVGVECDLKQQIHRARADCERAEAERDELRRRLDAVAQYAAAPNWGDIVCAGGKLELATTRLDEISAIAEGRENV